MGNGKSGDVSDEDALCRAAAGLQILVEIVPSLLVGRLGPLHLVMGMHSQLNPVIHHGHNAFF